MSTSDETLQSTCFFDEPWHPSAKVAGILAQWNQKRHNHGVRFFRWIDHLPPWLALGAVVSTGVYEPWELAVMAAPLAFAALAEWRFWGLASWRRALEFLALIWFLGLVWARIGLLPSILIMLFMLSGIRLCLPRETSQRRQLLLMGFLAWITTAISTYEIQFLLWSILWVAGAGLALMQQSWEASARLRHGPPPATPFSRLPGWTASAVLISALFFLMLPRITLGLRAFPWVGTGFAQAGLSDSVNLGNAGPIAQSRDVVMRILPSEADRTRGAQALGLLRGIVLESLEGQTWQPHLETPRIAFTRTDPETLKQAQPPGALAFECLLAPTSLGVLPVPYGRLSLGLPQGVPVLQGPGGSVRWAYAPRRAIPVWYRIDPAPPLQEPAPSRRRAELLTHRGEGTESADRWSRRIVPGELPPPEMAARLAQALQSFTYTLENPSGTAANPLEDFLERSHAGHCEYFASALALMLRYRGIPARIVNGYRLGPWIGEGGYWLVTQNEAHSWVEFYDPGTRRWLVADPTPAPGQFETGTLWAALQRWTDAIRFRWDRHVVRFSGEDQLAGFEWLRAQWSDLLNWRPDRTWLRALAALVGLSTGLWAWRRWGRPQAPASFRASGCPVLKPLLRAAGHRVIPGTAETARQWLQRLAALQPERAESLARMADEVDRVAYGGGDPHRLKAWIAAEAKFWRRLR